MILIQLSAVMIVQNEIVVNCFYICYEDMRYKLKQRENDKIKHVDEKL